VATDNFLAVRSLAHNNELFYGRLVLNSDTASADPMTLIKIDTRVTVWPTAPLTVQVAERHADHGVDAGIVGVRG
jgi:hypothetical protein